MRQSTLERPEVGAPDGTAATAPARSRRQIFIIIGAIAVVVALIFGIRYLTYSARHTSTDDAQVNGNITNLGARVKGQIVAVYVEGNQQVHKGQLLLQIDPRDYQVAVDQAQAAYQQALNAQRAAQIGVPQQATITAAQSAGAQAQIAQAQGGVTAAQAKFVQAQQQVPIAQDQLRAAQSAVVKAGLDLQRARTLASEGAIPQNQFDAAQTAYVAAVAARDSAQKQVQLASQGVSEAQAGVEQAQALVQAGAAQLEQAQAGNQTTAIKSSQAATSAAQTKAAYAALQAAKLQLSYTTVRAPVDGVVSKKSVSVGDSVAVSQPLMAIADQAQLWVTANLKETQITHVRVGQAVDIHVDAFPKQTFTGKVQSLSPATGATFALIPPDNATGNFTKVVQRVPIRIAIDASSDPQHVLRQGLSAEVTIDISNS